MSSTGSSDDLNADHYAKYSSLQSGHAEDILRTLRIDPHAEILDVGCGDGRNTVELAKKAIEGNVTGVDISPSMISYASKNFPEDHFPNLHFQLSSIEEAKFSHPFNLITSFSCFHWLKEPKTVMQKLANCLEKNGELLILTYPKESPYYQYLEKALEKYPEFQHLSANHTMLSAQEYRDFFEEEHFRILNFTEETIFAEYKNEEEIFNFIKGWVNNYVLLPEHLQDAFIHEVIQAILDDPAIQKDPLIRVPYTALTMRIQK
ncbi:MAG: methyltransferase domain-containing protein [Rhabdochlamydiaceae bacterium]|nr:methyltransferase domain-containing protein [Rhabdochlamydiaceae bacterium]